MRERAVNQCRLESAGLSRGGPTFLGVGTENETERGRVSEDLWTDWSKCCRKDPLFVEFSRPRQEEMLKELETLLAVKEMPEQLAAKGFPVRRSISRRFADDPGHCGPTPPIATHWRR
jgi:hypothetical protein